MFKCEKCMEIAPPKTQATRIVVKRRNRMYCGRRQAHQYRNNGKIRCKDDPGGAGTEIEKEILVCPQCADRMKAHDKNYAQDHVGNQMKD